MIASLIQKLFKVGEISNELREEIEKEEIELSEEKISGSITYINFRRPGKRCNWNRRSAVFSLFIATEKLICLAGSKYLINIPFSDGRFRQMSFELEKDNVLIIGFESGLFHNDWSGQIECRFKTDKAKVFFEKLKNK